MRSKNNKVALTDAEVSYEWLTPNHDWKNTNPETLAVSYVRLKSSAAQKPASSGARKYAGYQVRLYYHQQLQDVRAEPTKLLNLLVLPLTLSN